MKNWTTYTIILSLLVEFNLAQQWMNFTSQQHRGVLPKFSVGTASYLAPDMFILGANAQGMEGKKTLCEYEKLAINNEDLLITHQILSQQTLLN